jgi:hypothetical protein
MSLMGVIDGWFTALFGLLGIVYPQYQLDLMLILIAFLVVLILRWMGGFAGWFLLLFLTLLLLHRIIPPEDYRPAPQSMNMAPAQLFAPT